MSEQVNLKEKRDAERKILAAIDVDYDDPFEGMHGVLLSDKIDILARTRDLVKPYNPDLLKPSAYELTIGDEWFIGGRKFGGQSEVADRFTINPFEVAIIKTGERIALPRFLIARWNLRVKLAYKGLLWVGAAQVDAGYRGFLFCPIYNLSDKPVELTIGEEIAVMDFIKTTPFSSACKKYEIPKRLIIEDYSPEKLQSALDTQLKRKIESYTNSIDSVKEDVRKNERHINTYSVGMFTVIAILVALMAGFFGLKDTGLFVNAASPFLVFSIFAGTAFAVLVSLFQWVIKKKYASKTEWKIFSGFALILSISLGLVGYNFNHKNYKEQIEANFLHEIWRVRADIQNEINKLKQEIGKSN